MSVFIEAADLLEHRSDPALRVIDARSVPHGGAVPMRSGRERYLDGHVPGAVHLDYAVELRDPASAIAVRVAPPERFARIMGDHGIGDGHRIVAYDDGDVPFAARVVWMLRLYGHDAEILAGGLPAWIAAGGPLAENLPSHAATRFTVTAHPELRASRADVLAVAEGRSAAQLLETQRDRTYAQRDRDLPRAVRLSGNLLLEDARGGRPAERATIDGLVAAAGLDRTKRTIVSCGSGVSAAGSYLALSEAGFTDLAVYDGSWLDWQAADMPTVPKPAR